MASRHQFLLLLMLSTLAHLSLALAPPARTIIPRSRPIFLCDAATTSLRQRLREVHVDPSLLREVTAVVSHKRPSIRHAKQSRADPAAGLPLHNPFGTKPRFVASADRISSLPPADPALPEIAFIGRSNVGKSSLLNALTGVASLAKVSDKPGKTQALNFFELGRKENAFRLVDMPGYGFAFAKDEAVAKWRELSANYLTERGKTLKLVLVLLDAKVGLKSSDLQMLQFLEAAKVKYTLVLTKADAAGAPNRAAQQTALTLGSVKRAKHFVRPPAIVSARTGAGVGRLQRRLIETATGRDPLGDSDGGWNVQQGGRGRGAAGGRGAGGLAAAVVRGRGRGGRGQGGGRGRAAAGSRGGATARGRRGPRL